MAQLRVLTLLTVSLCFASPAVAAYVNFEAGHVRPLALAPDGSRLFAVNTPDNRLAIFELTPTGLTLAAEIPVGLRPVAVAVRDAGGGALEAWVVNHLSDSVSVVSIDDTDPSLSRVIKTLLVGDEPRDIVFGGAGGSHAFIATARRGQHDTVPAADFATPGIGRALVFVFDAGATGAGIGGTPVNVIELFSDAPRALAVSGDGSIVYAAAFKSGNGTTAIGETEVASNGGVPSMPPGATASWPDTSLIVKHDPVTDRWEDEDGTRNWNPQVPFELPDVDVFLIDATASPPALQPSPNAIPRVGSVLFNMAVRPGPGHGQLYVSNLEMKNHLRFTGFVGTTNGLQGRFVENRVSVVSGLMPTPIHLNGHVDYSVPTGPPTEVDQSLGIPLDMTFDSSGQTLYLTAFGSSRVAVLDADDLEAGTVGTDRIDVGGGPSGVVLDETRDRLYVMTRFGNEVVAIDQPGDSVNRSVLGSVPLATPEPTAVREGRPFLYDTALSSGHGDASCGTCHLFGDMDKLAWDLGDPFGSVTPNPNPMIPLIGGGNDFHPNKGPMTTQSLRGLPGQGPLHWRGDKTNQTDPMDVPTNFDEFNEAFVNLLGRSTELDSADFQKFNDFVMTLVYPPTPVRALDDSLDADQADGENVFVNVQSAVIFTCNDCHLLPTGTDGSSLDEVAAGVGAQTMKVPHLRNMYEKVGAFSSGGDEISGFGLIHDGSILSMSDFVGASVFSLNNSQENDLEAFLMAVDTGVAAMVGQQITVDASNRNDAAIVARLDLMEARAAAGDCTLVVKGVMGGEPRGAFYLTANDQYWTDKAGEPLMTQLDLRDQTQTLGQEMTFTCSPPGTGQRMGINRDEDLFLDASDNCPAVSNDDQTDTDGNGIGDACETVPEPGVYLLLAAGIVGLAGLDRRRRVAEAA